MNVAALTLIAWVCFCFCFPAFGEEVPSPSGLQTDIMLHPLDSFTAFTLKKNEVIFNQSPWTLPLPSWAWWGVTDAHTLEIDLLPLLGGFFQKPYLPVPSVNLRSRLREGTQGFDPWLAHESMIQYLYEDFKQSDTDILLVKRRGLSWFNRLNASFKLSSRTYLHTSGGFTYAHFLELGNKKSGKRVVHEKKFFPDLSLGLDFRWKRWVSTHATASYGTTFVYLDNVPSKVQFAYGFRLAPFLGAQSGFWRTMRMELMGIYMHFPSVETEMRVELPIFPYFYWQWMW